MKKVFRWEDYHCKFVEMNLILGMHRKRPYILTILRERVKRLFGEYI